MTTTFRCTACGNTRELPHSVDAVRYPHACESCGDHTVHERVGYDPLARDSPVQADAARAQRDGWRVNENGNLVIGSDPPEPRSQERDDARADGGTDE